MATSAQTLTLLVHQLGRVVHLGGCDGAVVCRHLVVQTGRDDNVRKTRRCLCLFTSGAAEPLILARERTKTSNWRAILKLAGGEPNK